MFLINLQKQLPAAVNSNLIRAAAVPDIVSHFNQEDKEHLKAAEQTTQQPNTPEKCSPTVGKSAQVASLPPPPPPAPSTPSTVGQGTVGQNVAPKFSLMESPPEGISERPIDVGWVGGWATDFDVLLADPIGVKAFKDFLSREFSAENLSFYLACRRLTEQSGTSLSASIEHIYTTYLSPGATDPVNVDSAARKQIDAAFASGQRDCKMFAPSEKQVRIRLAV